MSLLQVDTRRSSKQTCLGVCKKKCISVLSTPAEYGIICVSSSQWGFDKGKGPEIMKRDIYEGLTKEEKKDCIAWRKWIAANRRAEKKGATK